MINWEQELIQLAGAARAEESMRMHTTFQVAARRIISLRWILQRRSHLYGNYVGSRAFPAM